MVVVTSRDFRANQSRYIGYARNGEDVILKSRAGSVRLLPVELDSTESYSRDLAAELRHALSDVRESMLGKKKLYSMEELIDELDR